MSDRCDIDHVKIADKAIENALRYRESGQSSLANTWRRLYEKHIEADQQHCLGVVHGPIPVEIT